MSHGLPVPRGWILDSRPFHELVARLPPAHDPRSLVRAKTIGAVLEGAAGAGAFVLREPLEAALLGDLETLWKIVGKDAPWGLAVRSSAIADNEDVTGMAELTTTELGIRGAGALADALRRVWASVMLPGALARLAKHGARDV